MLRTLLASNEIKRHKEQITRTPRLVQHNMIAGFDDVLGATPNAGYIYPQGNTRTSSHLLAEMGRDQSGQ